MKTTETTTDEQAARLAMIRRLASREQTRYSAGGREKTHKRPAPSMPQLRCLEDHGDSPVPARTRSPHDPYGWMSRADRVALNSIALSPDQIIAIANDTRLPGEIGYTYRLSAAVVLQIQKRAVTKRLKAKAK